jgi:hypothetical protein
MLPSGRTPAGHVALLLSISLRSVPRSIPMVMVDFLVFMAAGYYHIRQVIALLPSHLFLFCLFFQAGVKFGN